MPRKGEIKDRTGEKNINTFGSKMIIKAYRNRIDIDVYFPEYDWTFKNAKYQHFESGRMKCPYEKRYYGIGYLGEGKYKVKENGKTTKYFDVWFRMLQRCYDPKYQEKYPTYKGCSVEEHMLNFQNACEFFDSIYYEIPGERMCLDKDILKKGNKTYSRSTCLFVPERINLLFVKSNSRRGKHPIGVNELPSGNYQVNCGKGYNNGTYLGTYSTEEEAFQVYKQHKEKIMKEVIDSYEGKIPEPFYSKLREVMYNYEVKITD